jgi:hypothetical protein
MDTAERFTAYAHDSIGTWRHSITAERDAAGWTLTLMAYPVEPARLPDDAYDLAAAWVAGIMCQGRPIASRRTERAWVALPDGPVELRPAEAAYGLARDVLGTAWTTVDKGNGFHVELR